MCDRGFPLKEHLKKKSVIDKLYAQGLSVTAYPLRAVFLELPFEDGEPLSKVLISVSKRRFRHAVDRNLVKRRLREAYRLNKVPFISSLSRMGKNMAVAILYMDSKHNSTELLKRKMVKLLASIIEKSDKSCADSL